MRRVLGVLLVVAGLAVVGGVALGGAQADPDGPLPAHRRALVAQVQQPGGAPQPGKDPAGQAQTGLADAATARQGIGAWGGKPAAKVKLAKVRRRPEDVLGDPKKRTRLASGCLPGYGRPGAQCVPARGAGNKALACAYVVKLFPGGVAVTGKDTLKLDTNGDGLACGHGDQGVPALAHDMTAMPAGHEMP